MKTAKINNIIIFIFLFHVLFIQIFSNYIILPFNAKKVNSSSLTSKTNYYTLLSIGQPKNTIFILEKVYVAHILFQIIYLMNQKHLKFTQIMNIKLII